MKYGLLASMTAGLSLAALGAGASELLFSWTDVTGDHVTWEQSSDPTPITSNAYSTDIAVSDYTVLSGLTLGGETNVIYYTAGDSGGFDTQPHGSINATGPQIWGGTLTNPTFSTGVFTGLVSQSNGTLTITALGTPEPAAWALMLCGIAGLGAAFRSRRRAKVI